MNTQNNLRPTIGLSPWFWRGGALLAALLIGLAAGMALARLSAPAAQAPVTIQACSSPSAAPNWPRDVRPRRARS